MRRCGMPQRGFRSLAILAIGASMTLFGIPGASAETASWEDDLRNSWPVLAASMGLDA
jgi:hypothetical protein